MKLTNKNLAIIVGALALLFIITTYLKNTNTKNKLDTNIIAIDTTAISKITIIKPQHKETPIHFSKTATTWNVTQGNINSEVKNSMIQNLLAQLKDLKATRLVVKSKDAWKKYQLTDSTATKVRIVQNGTTEDVYLGKIKFNPPTGQNPYNRQGMSGGTYFRVGDNPKVYLAEGMLANTFNRSFNSWRNNDFSKLNKDIVTQIQFDYKDKANFVLQKKDSLWTIGEQQVQLDKVNQYLTKLSNKNNNNFNDSYTTNGTPDGQITVTGNNMETLKIQSFRDSLTHKFYLKSTLNPSVLFESDSIGVHKELFVDHNYFLKTTNENP